MSRNVDYGSAWRLCILLGICAVAVSQAQLGSVYKHNLGYLLSKGISLMNFIATYGNEIKNTLGYWKKSCTLS